MSKRQNDRTDILVKYIENYPNLAINTLARKLKVDHPILFPDSESTRSRIRYYKGSMGNKARKEASGGKLGQKLFKTDNINKLLDEISKPVDFDYNPTPYQIPKNIKKLGIINDVHIPLHDPIAMKAAYKYLKDIKIDGLLINGDLFDFYWLAKYAKDYRHFTFKDELQMCRQELARIRQIFGDIPIFFKEGNHEERWTHHLRDNAQALYGLDEFQLDVLCHARELGLIWIKERKLIKYGNLNIAHGHEFKAGIITPVNIARTYFMKANTNLAIGHHHTTQEYSSRDINGTVRGCWAIGGLCNLQQHYNLYNNQNHGFAYVERESAGDFEFNNKKIINGKVK